MSVKKSPKPLAPAEQATLDHQYQLDHQIVKGVFRNIQQKNNPVRFPYRKYKQDPIKWYPGDLPSGKPDYFVDGRTYEIPLMVANHLNNRCYREVSQLQLQNGNYGQQHQVDSHGNRMYEAPVETVERKHRFMFVNTDFKPVKGWEEQSGVIEVNKKIL